MKPLARLSAAVALVAILTSPWVIRGARESLVIAVADASQWLPPEFPSRLDYEAFRRHFESGDLLLISWDGCRLDDPRLETLIAAVRSAPELQDPAGRPLVERILSGGEVFRRLQESPAELSDKQARRRLEGVLLGTNGTTMCLATFTPAGILHRDQAVAAIRQCLVASGIPEPAQRLAGPVMDGHDVDRASREALNFFAPVSSLVSLLCCYWCLRSWRLAALVFGLSVYCQGATLAIVHYSGQSMTPLMIVMPSLVLVLGVSGGIHLVNYHRDAYRMCGPDQAAREALRLGWLPCTLSAGTTAVGMASLLTSHLQPIRDFGWYSALGVMLTLIVLLLLVPGVFQQWPHLARTKPHAQKSRLLASFQDLPRGLVRYHGWISGLLFLGMVGATWGLPRVTASVQISTLFPPASRILRDYSWLEEHVGPLVPIEILVRFDSRCNLSPYDRLQLVAAVERELRRSPEIRGTLSAATFLPESAITRSGPGLVARGLVNRKWEGTREQLAAMRYLSAEAGEEVWRITVRSSALGEVDFSRFLDELRSRIEPVLTGKFSRGAEGISHLITGAMPLVHTLQHELLDALFASFLTALIPITLVMIVDQRSLLAGLVAMIPNIFPMVVMFGLLGWTRTPMDIGTVMTASVALGMAIDGTLHYLTFFRRSLAAGLSRSEAIHQSLEQAAPAMTESSWVCAAGMAIFAGSSFLPTQRFAWLMVGLIAAALAGDLIQLPALLAGPLGRCFTAGSQAAEGSAE